MNLGAVTVGAFYDGQEKEVLNLPEGIVIDVSTKVGEIFLKLVAI